MKAIELNVDLENPESTSFPWWVILDPSHNMRASCHSVASQITGPFFSRDAAQRQLSATRYNYSKRAVVYCLSGCYSGEYSRACKKVEQK